MSGHSRRTKKVSRKSKTPMPKCVVCGKNLPRRKSRFCSHHCSALYYSQKRQQEWENKWLSGEIDGYYETDHWGKIPNRIRTYLFRIHQNRCSKCGWGERNQYTGLIPLEVEHIDGNYKNNRPENLTLLCPNCHSLTSTYRGANAGKGRSKTWTPIIENNI